MTQTIIVKNEESGERIDALLSKTPELSLSRAQAQKLLANGAILAGGKIAAKSRLVKAGDLITIDIPEPETAAPAAQAIALDIVLEDNDVVVVNKPRGMVTHPAPGHADGTLVNALIYHCGGSLSGIGGVKRPGIVHRIDKDTSGLIIAAKNDFAHLALSAQLKDHSLRRIYEAVCVGCPREMSGVIDAPIGRSAADRKKMAVPEKNSRTAAASKALREAITRYEVLEKFTGYSHIRCILETGRTHQIRVHMAHIGHPLLGDMTYGRKKPELGLSGQCLHARELRFIHPRGGEVTLKTELPEYFQRILRELG